MKCCGFTLILSPASKRVAENPKTSDNRVSPAATSSAVALLSGSEAAYSLMYSMA
jgi:hypothetical protein